MVSVSYYPDSHRERADISAGVGGLELQTRNSTLLWPWRELKLTWGGHETRLMQVSYQGQSLYIPGLEALAILEAHLEDPAQIRELKQARRHLRSGQQGRLWLLAGAGTLTLSLLVVWGSWHGLLWSRDYALSHIPVSWEEDIGAQAFNEMRKETPLCSSEILQQTVQKLGQQLQPKDSLYTLQYSVLRNESINAFALPGGHIGLHAALIAQVPGPEALLGVMAHEAAHVYQQHGLKSMLSQMGLGLLILLVLGDMGSVMLALGGMGVGLMSLSFSRVQEAEADQVGLQLLQEAGFDPAGLPTFFSWMSQEEQQTMPAFLSTHPLSEQRMARMQQALTHSPSSQPQAPLKVDWPALQSAAADCLKEQ